MGGHGPSRYIAAMAHEPIIVSTWSFGLRGHAAAWPALEAGGSSLDAVDEVCRAIDADPEIDSVGFGGLPDRDGNVTLDGCIMRSPAECGSVCAVRMFMHPVSIARRVMEATPHVMLAGEGADAFALSQGMKPAHLVSDRAREEWEQWKRDPKAVDQTTDKGSWPARPIDTGAGGRLFHDTIGVLAIDRAGVMAGACSTSGMPFKLPGRVGDSPIIGSGLYVHPRFGGATATGAGELVMGQCSSFLIVELMRRGATPAQAIEDALSRLREEHELREEHQVGLIALTPDGEWSAGALREGFKVSVTSAERSEAVEAASALTD